MAAAERSCGNDDSTVSAADVEEGVYGSDPSQAESSHHVLHGSDNERGK